MRGPVWLAKLETLSILYVSVFLTRIGFGAILWIFPVYIQASSAVSGIIIALYPAVEGFSALPVGAYVDRSGRRRAFALGMILISILTLAIGLSNNLVSVGVAHALSGLAAALITVSSLTMITDLTREENRGAGMGAFNLSTLGGYGLGIFVGVAFSQVFSSNLGDSFLVVAGILGLAAIFALFALREPPHEVQERRTLKQMYESLTGDVASIFPIWFSLTVVLGFYLFTPRLIKDANPNFSQSSVSQFAPLILLGLLVLGSGALLFGRISDKVGRTKTMILGAAGEVGFLLVFPNIFQKLVLIPIGTPWLDTYYQIGPILILAGALFFTGSALLPSVLAYMADKSTLGFRGATMGLYSLFLSAGLAFGTVLAGLANQFAGAQGVFYSAAIILTVPSIVSIWMLRQERRPTRRSPRPLQIDPRNEPASKPI